MKAFRRAIALLATLPLLVMGCMDTNGENGFDMEPFDMPLEAAAYGGSPEPPNGMNGLVPAEFWSEVAQLGLRDLGKMALDKGGTITLSNGSIIPVLPSTPAVDALLTAHPAVMRYMMKCALSDKDEIFDPINHTVLQGWWKLAPSWLSSPNGIQGRTDEQMFATGCMIALLNSTGAHVNVLLEGATSAIDVHPIFNGDFKFNESTVHGNMFTSTMVPSHNDPAFYAYLCREDNLANVCPSDGGRRWIDKRLCDNAPATCGIIDIGKCSVECVANGEHWECPTAPGGMNYVRQTVGVQLYDPVEANECR